MPKGPFDYTKVMTSLHANLQDHISVKQNASELDHDQMYVDEIDPIYNMDFCSESNASVVAVGYESGAVSLIDTNADVNKKLRAGKNHI